MTQDLLALVERVEKAHFRTHQDTGANPCALMVWNIVRQEAGLPRLTSRDLMVRALTDYQQWAGRALQGGDSERASQYAEACRKVQVEIDTYDEAHPKIIVRETRCFS